MSAARIGELERRLANVTRAGTILEADYSNARVRVKLGKNTTAWLPWVSSRAGGDKTWHAPEVGEQVLVLSPAGDLCAGFVIGGVYKQDRPANADAATVSRTTYADGAVVEYDRAAHAYAITIPAGGKATVKTGASSTLEVAADAIRLTVGGTQLVLSASGIQITSPTGLNINGAVTQTGGPLTSNGIALATHTHGGVTSGISNTAGPNP
jgi:phage baseplate assembly protein V